MPPSARLPRHLAPHLVWPIGTSTAKRNSSWRFMNPWPVSSLNKFPVWPKAKLPGALNVFFRDELGARTYNATFYEGFDSVSAETIFNNLFSLVNQSLPAGFKMTDKTKGMNKHLSVFKTDKSGISLTETGDKKRSYYNITIMIGDL